MIEQFLAFFGFEFADIGSMQIIVLSTALILLINVVRDIDIIRRHAGSKTIKIYLLSVGITLAIGFLIGRFIGVI